MKKLLFTAIASLALITAFSACHKKVENNASDANAKVEAPATEKAAQSKGDEPVPAEVEQKDEELTKNSSPRGLAMTVDLPVDNMKFVGVTGTVRGPYSNQMMYDAMVFIQVDRLAKAKEGKAGIEAAIREIHKDIELRDMVIEKTDEVAKVSDPAYKVTYITGHNEDTQTNTDYYIVGSQFDFRLHTACGVDFVDDYKDMIDALAHSIKIEENNSDG